jgi:Ca2+-binding EF-hand superfamily protein
MSIERKKEKFIKELKSKLNQKCYGNTSEETVLIRAFKYFDLDNTGFSDIDSFLNTVRKIGITSLNDEEIAEIFSSFDEEKKGEIDYREFVSELFGNKSLSKKKKSSQIELEESAKKSEIKSEMEERNEITKDYTPEEILNIMREKLNERGVQGICSIARNFRIIDENNSQTIDFSEFKQVCDMFNFGLDETQLKKIFTNFDTENTGEIDYDEFIRTIRGEMNEFRQNLVQKVFEKLDIKKTGEITFKELNMNYCTKNHPDVLSGKISEEEALKEFEDTF